MSARFRGPRHGRKPSGKSLKLLSGFIFQPLSNRSAGQTGACLNEFPERDGILEGVTEQPLILMVDDDANDRFLLRRAFAKIGVLNPVKELDSGAAAIAYLNGDGPFEDRDQFPFPAVLLLDLHMPGTDGFAVLRWIRDKLTVGGLLIVVLSRLDEIKNIERAYQLGANSFLSKPGDFLELEQLIRSFHDYWLVHNRPPGTNPDGPSLMKPKL